MGQKRSRLLPMKVLALIFTNTVMGELVLLLLEHCVQLFAAVAPGGSCLVALNLGAKSFLENTGGGAGGATNKGASALPVVAVLGKEGSAFGMLATAPSLTNPPELLEPVCQTLAKFRPSLGHRQEGLPILSCSLAPKSGAEKFLLWWEDVAE
jgi:hypothetical protein